MLRYHCTKNFVILEADKTKLELAVASFDATPAQEEAVPADRLLPPRIRDVPLPIPEKIRAKWQTRLVKSGFSDIEYNNGALRGALPGSFFAMHRGQDDHLQHNYSGRAVYFQLASHWLRSNAARRLTKCDRAIWRAYTEGYYGTEIAHKMGLSRRQVARKIKKLCKLSGIRRYLKWE